MEANGLTFPKMVRLRQTLWSSPLKGSIPEVIQREFDQLGLFDTIRPGQTIAISAGSRGITDIALILKAIVDQIKRLNAVPIIFTAMGSHGGGTVEGQLKVLAMLGIASATLGCEIRAGTEVVELGWTESGLPVYLDKFAYEADGIIIVNRIKPHTDFRGPVESGLMKMIAIGAGNIRQAEELHRYGVRGLRELMPEVARAIIERSNIIAGFAILEDGYHRLSQIVGVTPGCLEQTEMALLQEVRRMTPCLPGEDIDILIIDRIGKDISGTGMDLNVIGRMPSDDLSSAGPRIRIIIALALSENSHGNATGIGYADLTVRRLAEKIDFEVTYKNVLTGQRLQGGALPVVMKNDCEAIQVAITKLIDPVPIEQVRLIRIQDTLSLDILDVSEALAHELKGNPDIHILREPEPMHFDENGNLI